MKRTTPFLNRYRFLASHDLTLCKLTEAEHDREVAAISVEVLPSVVSTCLSKLLVRRVRE